MRSLFFQVNSTAENGTSDPFDSQFTISTSLDDSNDTTAASINSSAAAAGTANPFSDMSATDTSSQPSSNPLYNLMDDDLDQGDGQASMSANPLYELSSTANDDDDDDDTNTNAGAGLSSDPTFDTNVTTTTTTSATTSSSEVNEEGGGHLSANPLYDLMESEVTVQISKPEEDEDEEEEVVEVVKTSSADDFMGMDFVSGGDGDGSGMVMEKSTPCEDIVVQANDGYEDQVVPDLEPEPEAAGGPREVTHTAQVDDVYEEEEAAAAAAGSFDQNVELFIREEGEESQETPSPLAAAVEEDIDGGGGAGVDVGEQQQQQQQEVEVEVVEEEELLGPRSRSRSPSRHSISSEGEVLNEVSF